MLSVALTAEAPQYQRKRATLRWFSNELEAKVGAQVHFPDFAIEKYILRSAGCDHMSFAHDISPLAYIQGLPYIVVGDEHAYFSISKLTNHPFDLVDGYWINAGKGLVKENEGRIQREGSCDLDSSSLASR